MRLDEITSEERFVMTEEERARISEYIETTFGIKMSESKKPLLTGRLSKRLRTLRIRTYGDYFDYLHSPQGHDEMRIFTDLVSTHETHFFRENGHFEFLTSTGLPTLAKKGAGTDYELNVLCAACSTGEEVYSAACTIEEFAHNSSIRNFRYRITGTDISSGVIQTAVRGVYDGDDLNGVPGEIRKYFMKSRDQSRNLIRVIPELRAHTRFIEMNLIKGDYTFDCQFDIIFCRNVMIYFSKENQMKTAEYLCGFLSNDGFFLVGHSENLFGFRLPLKLLTSATYVKIDSGRTGNENSL